MLNYRLDMLRCAQRLVIKRDLICQDKQIRQVEIQRSWTHQNTDRENMLENRLDMLEIKETGHVGIETDWTWWNTDRLDMEYK